MHARPAFPPALFQSFDEPSDPTQVAARIAALRTQLAASGLDGFLVPRADVHQGEYVPDRDARLAWLTGFTGSAGLAIVTRDAATLLVDGRYTLQAPTQTDTTLIAVADSATTRPEHWLSTRCGPGARIGYDAWLHTPGQIEALETALAPSGIALVPVPNLVDAIWTDRPAPPQGPVEAFGENRSGRSTADKLAFVRAALAAQKADAIVLTLPESLCWLFNVRGRDLPHNPFVLGFAIVPASGTPTVFLAPDKLTPETANAFGHAATLEPVEEFPAALTLLAESGASVWLNPAAAPAAVKTILTGGGATLVEERDPIALEKARKNPVERAGMREAQTLDSIAMCRFLAWFDRTAPLGGLTEIDIVNALESFRRDSDQLVDISFETIAGAGPNGAIVHYRVSEASNRTLIPGELMLVDSGGQYLSGTTDITRTMASGPVGDEEKDRFTRVLKGMIGVSRAIFPRTLAGNQIDVFARAALWQAGLDYAHGTGHGVGAFLSVHEGPAGISPRATLSLEPGMILSNEPGFYKTGAYGIRIENLLTVVESSVGETFLGFETLTYVPIDRRLIDPALLDPAERDWLNAYHAETAARVRDALDAADRAWLDAATAPI